MTTYAVTGTDRGDRERKAHALWVRARVMIRDCSINWTPDPPTIVFTPDLSAEELALLGILSTDATTPMMRMVGLTGGTQGIPGPQGPAGATGPAGSTGPAGPIGNTGPAGPQGNTGNTGSQGSAGSQGSTGAQGVKGDTGNTGSQGPQGIQGIQGPAGNDGAVGPQGIPGVIDVKEAEIDFGTYPRSAGVFTVTDVLVTPSTQLLAYQSGTAATGKDADDNELDALIVRAVAGSGSFTVYADALTGPVSGRFKIAYLLG